MIIVKKKEIGNRGENDAANFLKKEGYKIVEMNYTCKFGEIDIIAIEKKFLVFVEVKSRSSETYGAPEYAITKHKMRQIIRVAESYLFKKKIKNTNCRFDVVAINYNIEDNSKKIRLIKDAFQDDRETY